MARRRRSVDVAYAPVPYDPMAEARDPVAPPRFMQSQSSPRINLPDIVGHGENPGGYTAQVPNGTAHAGPNTGHNQRHWFWNRSADGARWDGNKVNWGKNGNRSGE